MHPLLAIEVPSYQSQNHSVSTGSSTNKLPENKNRSKERSSRAETKIEQLEKFSPDLNVLEERTQRLLRDQMSLNTNFLGRLQMLEISSSPQGRRSVRGPLQHPYTHFQQPSNSGRFSANYDAEIGAVDVEMSDAPDVDATESVISLKDDGRQNEDTLPSSIGSPIAVSKSINLTLSPSEVSHHSTSNMTNNSAQHPALITTTTNITEQIELEISHLIVKKHNELRLIESELAKAQIMLEQLRRVHLRPFNLVQNENGKVYAVRFVVRSCSGEMKRQNPIGKRQMRDEKAAEELEMEERKKGGSGMELRNRYVRR